MLHVLGLIDMIIRDSGRMRQSGRRPSHKDCSDNQSLTGPMSCVVVLPHGLDAVRIIRCIKFGLSIFEISSNTIKLLGINYTEIIQGNHEGSWLVQWHLCPAATNSNS